MVTFLFQLPDPCARIIVLINCPCNIFPEQADLFFIFRRILDKYSKLLLCIQNTAV